MIPPVRRRAAQPAGVVAGRQVAGLLPAVDELPERGLPLLPGRRAGAPGDRRDERPRCAAFDKGGKYLFVTASTNIGPAVGSGMSVFNRPVSCAVDVAVLRQDDPPPLAPESDGEKAKDADKEKAVALVLEALKRNPVRQPPRPPFPDDYRPGTKEPAEGK